VHTFVASYGQQRRQIRDEKPGLTNSLGLCGFMHQSGEQGGQGDTDAGVGIHPLWFCERLRRRRHRNVFRDTDDKI
jgi:hypothetical protein